MKWYEEEIFLNVFMIYRYDLVIILHPFTFYATNELLFTSFPIIWRKILFLMVPLRMILWQGKYNHLIFSCLILKIIISGSIWAKFITPCTFLTITIHFNSHVDYSICVPLLNISSHSFRKQVSYAHQSK